MLSSIYSACYCSLPYLLTFKCKMVCTSSSPHAQFSDTSSTFPAGWRLRGQMLSVLNCSQDSGKFNQIFQIDEQRINRNSSDLYCLSGTMRVRNISEKKRFGFYAIYAFGLSLLLTAMLPIVDSIDGFPDELKPRVGNDKCYLKSM